MEVTRRVRQQNKEKKTLIYNAETTACAVVSQKLIYNT